MTPVIESLRRCAEAQIRFSTLVASTQGRDVADDIAGAWQGLLTAIELENKPYPPKEPWSGVLFTPKPKKKKT